MENKYRANIYHTVNCTYMLRLLFKYTYLEQVRIPTTIMPLISTYYKFMKKF